MATTVGQRSPYGVGYTNEEIRTFFDAGFDIPSPVIGDLLDTIPMGDREGKLLKIAEADPVPPPQELSTDTPPQTLRIGHRVGEIRPTTWGYGYALSEEDERDSRVDEVAWAVQGIGKRMAYWPEKTFIELVFDDSVATFTGTDGKILFSATHNYTTSAATPGVPAVTSGTGNFSNISTGTGGGTTAVGSDWYLGYISPSDQQGFYTVERQGLDQQMVQQIRKKEFSWTRRFGVGYRKWQNWEKVGNTALYENTAQVQADFATSRAAIFARTDAHGEKMIVEQPGGRWLVLANNVTPSTMRFLDLAFNPQALASDDSNRELWQLQVETRFIPWLAAA